MQSKIAVGISLPKHIISEIDIERGDVSRSRYVLRLLEKTILETALSQEKKKEKALVRSQAEPSAIASQAQIYRHGHPHPGGLDTHE